MAARNGLFSSNTVFAITIFFLVAGVLDVHAQSLSNLRIGDDVSRLSSLGYQPSDTGTYKSFDLRKWRFSNENELSVTTSKSGRIVYVESDWGGKTDETACDLPGLKFGVTTLSELRRRLGSNGFEFQNRAGVMEVSDGIIMMNSYEVGNIVVTFITKVTEKEYVNIKESGKSWVVADHARLDAISIAEAGYAEGEWGDRIYDPNYKKVEWK